MGPAVPEAAGFAPAEWVHSTTWKKSEKFAGATPVEWVHYIVWKKSEKYAGAVEMNARLMIDRAPIGQPVPSEYEGG